MQREEGSLMERPEAIAFDAFGTLFDLSALEERMGAELFPAFKQRLIPWTWLLTGAGRYEPLPRVAEQALRAAAAEQRVELGDHVVARVLDGLEELPAFPDAAPALERLSGRPLAVLSNGTEPGLAALLANAGIAERFEHVLCADQAGRFKPAGELYALAPQTFGVPAERVLLVTSNDWDSAMGKLSGGLRTAWVSRGAPLAPVLGVQPDLVVEDLGELADRLAGAD